MLASSWRPLGNVLAVWQHTASAADSIRRSYLVFRFVFVFGLVVFGFDGAFIVSSGESDKGASFGLTPDVCRVRRAG